MLKTSVLVLTLLCSIPVSAHTWVLNTVQWSRSYAETSLGDGDYINDSGVVYRESSAGSGVSGGSGDHYAGAGASAVSSGNWDGSAAARAFGPGSWAGWRQPFNEPIVPTGVGSASLDYRVTRTTASLHLKGLAHHDQNGFFELSVLDIRDLSPEYVSNIFLNYGSLERALSAGYIDENRVLFRRREKDIPTLFNFAVYARGLPDENLLVAGLAHAASVPEPSSLGLLGLGGAMFAASRFRRAIRSRAPNRTTLSRALKECAAFERTTPDRLVPTVSKNMRN